MTTLSWATISATSPPTAKIDGDETVAVALSLPDGMAVTIGDRVVVWVRDGGKRLVLIAGGTG